MIFLLAAALLSAPAARPRPDAGVAWEKTFEAAVAKADKNRVPIMVDFWADWCGPCHMLDRTTYQDPVVTRLSRRFVSVKVNVEGRKDEVEMAQRYLASALPTIAFLSPSGRQLWRVNSYVGPDQMPAMIEEALKVSARVMTWESTLAKNPKDLAALRGLAFHQYAEMQQTAQADEEGRLAQAMFDDASALLTRAMAIDSAAKAAERKKVRRVLALLRGTVGDTARAEALLKEALALTPAEPAEDADAQVSLGELYVYQKNHDLAIATFRKVVKNYPKTRWATRAAEQLERLQAR